MLYSPSTESVSMWCALVIVMSAADLTNIQSRIEQTLMKTLTHGQIDKNTKHVNILLHGFPGISTQQNRDLAAMLFEKLGLTTIVVFYPGLSINPGRFKYTKAYQLVCDTLNQCLSINSGVKFNLFGHSFGGYLSLRLAKDFNSHIDKIFFLSPLLHVINNELLEDLVAKLYRENPQLERHSIEELHADHKLFVPNYKPEDLKKYLANIDIKLLQSKEDKITPTPVAKEFIKDSAIKYEESWQEHSFTSDRHEVFEKVCAFFSH